jgi:hypothetical protein
MSDKRFVSAVIHASTNSQKTGETEAQKTSHRKVSVLGFASPLSVVDRWVTYANLCRGGGDAIWKRIKDDRMIKEEQSSGMKDCPHFKDKRSWSGKTRDSLDYARPVLFVRISITLIRYFSEKVTLST